MQPLARLSKAAEWKEVKPSDQGFCGRRRGPQTAQDVVGPVVHQEAAEAADMVAQRPQRGADAAAQSELGERRR